MYVEHYNHGRPHRALDLKPPDPRIRSPIATATTTHTLQLSRRDPLGGLIHGVRSITWYVGNRNLRRSWLLFNLMLPIVGALGGTVFYVVLRAGLFSPSTSAAQASPFGFAAVAMLVGLFSEQALEKLRQLAAQMFAESPTGADHVDPVSGDAETPTTAAVTADQTGS